MKKPKIIVKEKTIQQMKLFKISMAEKEASNSTKSHGYYHVIAKTISEAVIKAEHNDKNGDKVVSAELIATDTEGLIR